MNTTHGRGHVELIEAAYDREGRVLALRGKSIVEVGAYASMLGAAIATFTHLLACGPYGVKAVAWEIVDVYTNTMATEAYRGAGRPEAAYIIERVMDEVAARTGVDRVEVTAPEPAARAVPSRTPRRPARSTTAGTTRRTLEKALARFDYAAACRARDAARARAGSSGSASPPSPRSAASVRAPARARSRATAPGRARRCASSRPATSR